MADNIASRIDELLTLESDNKRNDNIYKLINNNQNDNCLVMYDENCLFLGEVPSRIYEEYIENEVYDKTFEAIKISHHGTKDYFSKNLPESEKHIISNAKYGRCEISSKYPLAYSDVERYCTNTDECELYNLMGKECSACLVNAVNSNCGCEDWFDIIKEDKHSLKGTWHQFGKRKWIINRSL